MLPVLAFASSPQSNDGAAAQAVIFGLVILILYFLPSAAAWNKSHFSSVLVLNVFLGWTLVGWVIALAWALKKDADPQIIVQPAPPPAVAVLCRNCGKYSSPTAKFCENCGQPLAQAATA